MAEEPAFKPGDDVFVFYRMSKRCSPQRKYMAVLDQRHGTWRPRVGISDGWMPAKVVECTGGRVKAEYTWQHFVTRHGHFAERNSGWAEFFPVDEVRAAPAGQAGKLCPAGMEPQLVLITFRWGGMNSVVAPEQWGDTGSSSSDLFIDSFVDRAVAPTLGTNFEVWTVYVEDQSDMLKVASTAHLIFGPGHPSRRAPHVGGMYHLYPTSFEEGCIPTQETGSDGGAALVDQKAFFKMQQAMERAGVPSRFPHPSGFYELLSSKRWTYHMTLTPNLRVPPSISMPRMLCEQSVSEAADKAIATLTKVKARQAKMRGEPAPTEPVTKGVAKLGFSWEALDVKYWEGKTGEKGLEAALFHLTQNIEISGEWTGQPQDLEAVIIQEYVKHDLEVRLYFVEGKLECTIYTKFCKIKDNLEFGDFHEHFDQEKAAQDWVGGDLAALQDGERQCREIADHWLTWVEAQLCEMPPAIRFDFFVGRGQSPGTAVVWTLEICELGFSMLGEKELPNKVFNAMLRTCMEGSLAPAAGRAAASQQQPLAVPPAKTQQTVVPPPRPAAAGGPVSDAPTASGAARGGSKPQAVPAPEAPRRSGGPKDGLDEEGRPRVLHVMIRPGPGVTADQLRCKGRYVITPNVIANGAPVWVHESGDRFLYHGNDTYWYIGDEEEKDLNFDCDQGYIRHDSAGHTMPHLLEGEWERGEDWTWDPNIAFSLDGNFPPPTRASAQPSPQNKGKGKQQPGKRR